MNQPNMPVGGSNDDAGQMPGAGMPPAGQPMPGQQPEPSAPQAPSEPGTEPAMPGQDQTGQTA